MKAYIGPYSHWFRPARWFKDWVLWWHGFGSAVDWESLPDSKHDEYDKLDGWVSDCRVHNWLLDIENWVDNRSPRVIRVKIHDYDVWGMDHTLALIVVPMLKLLKEKKHGAPFVDDDDVPEELRSTAAPPCEEWQTDENYFKRWDWVMAEMIWAFEQLLDEDAESQFHYDLDPAKPRFAPGISFEESMRRGSWDKEGQLAFQHRKSQGLALFGKYFEALWD